MVRIINGRKYSTETAEKLCTRDNGYYGSDARYVQETLYRKRTGEYFLLGDGGAFTQYGESSGNWRSSGYAIVPLSDEDARNWVAQYHPDKYEEYFGECPE